MLTIAGNIQHVTILTYINKHKLKTTAEVDGYNVGEVQDKITICTFLWPKSLKNIITVRANCNNSLIHLLILKGIVELFHSIKRLGRKNTKRIMKP